MRTWRNGRRSRLKICYPNGCAGSSPAVRTSFAEKAQESLDDSARNIYNLLEIRNKIAKIKALKAISFLSSQTPKNKIGQNLSKHRHIDRLIKQYAPGQLKNSGGGSDMLGGNMGIAKTAL